MNPFDDIALLRVINTPTRGLGKTSLDEVQRIAKAAGSSFWMTIAEITDPAYGQPLSLTPRAKEALRAFRTVIENLIAKVNASSDSDNPVSEVIIAAIEDTGHANALRIENSEESMARLENLEELVNAAVDYDRQEENGLRDFIDHACWTCTVVKEDKSMRGFIDSGATWMEPLNEFRNCLKEIREDTSKRDGIRRNDSIGPGPFSSETRKLILRRLLALEKTVGRRLIEDAEIAYIQQQWTDKFDVTDSALAIAREFKREVGTVTLTPEDLSRDLALIDELAPRFEVQSIWATDLYSLVTERYPSFDSPSTRQQLLEDVIKVIENAVRQADRTEPEA